MGSVNTKEMKYVFLSEEFNAARAISVEFRKSMYI